MPDNTGTQAASDAHAKLAIILEHHLLQLLPASNVKLDTIVQEITHVFNVQWEAV